MPHDVENIATFICEFISARVPKQMVECELKDGRIAVRFYTGTTAALATGVIRQACNSARPKYGDVASLIDVEGIAS